MKSGTTAVFTFIRGEKLYVGWLGDSQAMLVRQGQPLQLVDPHKPEREVSATAYVTVAMVMSHTPSLCRTSRRESKKRVAW